MSSVTPTRTPGGRLDLQGLQNNYEQLLTEFETWTQQHSSAGSSKHRSRLQPLPTPQSDSKAPTTGKDQDSAPTAQQTSTATAAAGARRKATTPVTATKDASKHHDTVDTRAAPDASKAPQPSGGRALGVLPRAVAAKLPAADWTPGGGVRRKLEPLLEGVEAPKQQPQTEAGAVSSIAAAGGVEGRPTRGPSKSAPGQGSSSSTTTSSSSKAAAAGAGSAAVPSRRHSSSDVEGRPSHGPAGLAPLPVVGASTSSSSSSSMLPEQAESALVSGTSSHSSRRRSYDASSAGTSREGPRASTSISSSRQANLGVVPAPAAHVSKAGASHKAAFAVVAAAASHGAGHVAPEGGSAAADACSSGSASATTASSSKLPRLPPLVPTREDGHPSISATGSSKPSSRAGSNTCVKAAAAAVAAQQQQQQQQQQQETEGDVVKQRRTRVALRSPAQQHPQQPMTQCGAADATLTSRTTASSQAGPCAGTGCSVDAAAPGPSSGSRGTASRDTSQGSTPRLAAEASNSTWGRPPAPAAEESSFSAAGLVAEGSRASVGGSGLSSESMRLLQALRNRRVAAMLHGPHPHHAQQQHGLGATGAAAAAALGAGAGAGALAAMTAPMPEQATTAKLPPLPRVPVVAPAAASAAAAAAALASSGALLSGHTLQTAGPAGAGAGGAGSGTKLPGRHSRNGSWGSQPPSRQSSASLTGDSELMPVGLTAADSSRSSSHAPASAHWAGAHGGGGSSSHSRSSSTEHGHAAGAQQQEGPSSARGGLLLPPLPGSRRSSASQVPAEEGFALPPVASHRSLGVARPAPLPGAPDATAGAGLRSEACAQEEQQVCSSVGDGSSTAREGGGLRRVSSSGSDHHKRQGRARWEVGSDPPQQQQQQFEASTGSTVGQHPSDVEQRQGPHTHSQHYHQHHVPPAAQHMYAGAPHAPGHPHSQGYGTASSACAWTIPAAAVAAAAPAGPTPEMQAAGEPWSGALQQPAAVWPSGGTPHSNVLVCHEAATRGQQQGVQLMPGQYPPSSMQGQWQQQQQQQQQQWAWQQQQAVAQQHAYAYHQQQQQQQAVHYGYYHQQQQPQQAHAMHQQPHHFQHQAGQHSFSHQQQYMVQQQQQQQPRGGLWEAGGHPAAKDTQQALQWQHAQRGHAPGAAAAGVAGGDSDARGAGGGAYDQERRSHRHDQPQQPATAPGRAPVRVRPAPDVPWATYLDDDEPQPQQETPQHKAAATREDAGADRGVVGPKGHLPGMSASAIAKQRAEQQRAAWAGLSLGELLPRKLKPAGAAAAGGAGAAAAAAQKE